VVFSSLFFSFNAFGDSDEVTILNGILKANNARWVAGDNPVSTLSEAERLRHLGANRSNGGGTETTIPRASLEAGGETLPATFDWRNNGGVNYVTPVRNQGNCGSCWAFSTTAALESQILRAYPKVTSLNVNLSEQTLVSVEAGNYDSCYWGGYISGAASYIQQSGLPIQACFPYLGVDPDESTGANASNACANYQIDTYKFSGWSWINQSGAASVTSLKTAIYNYGPIVVTFDVYSDFYAYQSGVYHFVSGTIEGGHAVTAVGWDDTNQCFIVKNSWGPQWGESGYFRIAYTETASCTNFGEEAIAFTSSTMDSKSLPLADFSVNGPYTAVDPTIMVTSGAAPFTVSFQDTSTSPNTSTPINSWLWNFGDGNTSTAQNPSHIYTTAGKYTVSLKAGNSAGTDTATYTNLITVIATVPTANFTSSVTTGPAPLAVQFTSTSTGSITSYSWTFGDGSTSTVQNPSHTYTAAGTYTAKLTVTNSAGSSSKSVTITVTKPSPPVISTLTATPTSGVSPLTVQFTATSSSSGGAVTSWGWSFGDNTSAAAQNTSHIYTKPGTYTATVTAIGPGGTVTKSVNIVVNTPVVAAITASATGGTAPLTVNFSGTGSTGASSYSWNFGDGTTGSSSTASHTFSTVGTFTVTLTATGVAGNTNSATTRITTTAPQVVAKITTSTTSGLAPLAVSFSGASSTGASSYAWTFGDGTTASGSTASHTFSTAGTFTVTLKATGATGATSSATTTVTVTSPPLIAKIGASAASGYAPLAISFSSNGSTGLIGSYAWTFGDGATGAGATASHTYSTAGTFTTKLTVTGTSGATSSATTTITVSALPPLVANIKATPISGTVPLTVNFSGTGSTGLIGSYAWTFGDGATGAGATTSHIYTKTGTYTTKLVLTGTYNQSASATVTITVSAASKSTLKAPVKTKAKTKAKAKIKRSIL
jgi:PKD repeat protein